MALEFVKHDRLDLKSHPEFNETWVQERIADDPNMLGLGDLELVERERRQHRAGRLDLLLQDPDAERRYEVEVMLGPTDPSHIIRTIEYWDIEKRRYPAYEHHAVIVAENITSRFLNVLGLFAGSIPLVALQMSALQVADRVILDFAKVLDQTPLRDDDRGEPISAPTDRRYWEQRAGGLLSVVDQILEIVNEDREGKYSLNYNKSNITLVNGAGRSHFVAMNPGNNNLRSRVLVANKEEWVERLEKAGLAAFELRRRARVHLDSRILNEHEPLIRELLHQAREEFEA